MSEWISVEKRLPTDFEWALVYADGAMNCMAWNKDRKQWEDWTEAQLHNIRVEEITHWMPLPEPPQ